MTDSEFQHSLNSLGLSHAEAAQQLSVNSRTVRRWADGTVEIPGPVKHVLNAWMRLHSLGLAWRLDEVMLGDDNPEVLAEQIALYRQHAIDLDAVLQAVNARGGPAAPWHVDLEGKRATLGPMWVSFYLLPNGSFAPQCYCRNDTRPDMKRDAALLHDAYACIAHAISAPDRAKSVGNCTSGAHQS
jgi:hypothetical protein